MSMSEIVLKCYHGKIGHKEAEERFTMFQKDFPYLTRESDTKQGRFILSFMSKSGSVKHIVVPHPSAKKIFTRLEDAFEVIERMIVSNENCVHAVPVPFESVDNNFSDEEDEGPVSDLACYACEFVADSQKHLNSHHRIHFVQECSINCGKFIPVNSYSGHLTKCQETTPEVSCGQCDFKTKWIASLCRHQKDFHNHPHKCTLCKKSFNDEETLNKHNETRHTSNGDFKCPDCGKTFCSIFNRNRHRQKCSEFVKLENDNTYTKSTVIKFRRHTCPSCPHVSQSKVRLNRHILSRHRDKPPRKALSCDGCKYKTYKTSTFRSHLISLKHQKKHPPVFLTVI